MTRHANRNTRPRKPSASLAYSGNGITSKPAVRPAAPPAPKVETASVIAIPRPAPLPLPQVAPPAPAVVLAPVIEKVKPRRMTGRDWLWLGPALFGSLVGLYFILRYNGYWSETDTSAFTEWIKAMAASGHLDPPGGNIYPNGFSYQALSTFIVDLSGIDANTLQQFVYPLTAGLVALPAWMLYRELSDSRFVATLGTLLLFIQPEFLFVILRSSHEKFTRLLMLLALFWLVRSFRVRRQSAVSIALFYLSTFAFITSNNLLAHSFIVAVALALLLGWGLERFFPQIRELGGHVLQRLSYAAFICLGLVYLFTFYAYTPAAHDIEVLRDIASRVSALFLDVSSQATDSYAQVQAGWVSLPIYFLLSIANWAVLGASLLIWLWQAREWLLLRHRPPNLQSWLLWLLYAAFAVQGLASVVVDASGALSTNLQHRAFPSFSVVAVPIVANALVRWRPPQNYRRLITAGLVGATACIALLSVFKATNEPLFSNKWVFYRPAEITALRFANGHLDHSNIWTGWDERLLTAAAIEFGAPTTNNRFAFDFANGSTRDFVLSDITRMLTPRLNVALPVPSDAIQSYDNGDTQIYHQRPQTLYQR